MSLIIIGGSYGLFLCEPDKFISIFILPGGYDEHANIPPSAMISAAGQRRCFQDVDARR